MHRLRSSTQNSCVRECVPCPICLCAHALVCCHTGSVCACMCVCVRVRAQVISWCVHALVVVRRNCACVCMYACAYFMCTNHEALESSTCTPMFCSYYSLLTKRFFVDLSKSTWRLLCPTFALACSLKILLPLCPPKETEREKRTSDLFLPKPLKNYTLPSFFVPNVRAFLFEVEVGPMGQPLS